MTNNHGDYYEYGRQCYRAFTQSNQFAQFDNSTPPRDVIRLFLPPVDEGEHLTQMQVPLPKKYKEWLRGYEDERDVMQLREHVTKAKVEEAHRG